VDAQTLAALAKQHNIPSCVDLGSGSLVDLSRWGLPAEPTPQSVLNQGIDIVTFSGDKMLGGVQAGLIVGNKEMLAAIKSNPLKRALRADKITLASLEALLTCYENPETVLDTVPLLATLTESEETLRARGKQLAIAFPPDYVTNVEASAGQIGSGALPDKTIESVALTITHESMNATTILKKLRDLPTPVIGRIATDKVWLDLRGATPLEKLLETIKTNL
jgi:L-seryl-tRNA(Ser) seleniumtransferase